jgi:hypothetical protein
MPVLLDLAPGPKLYGERRYAGVTRNYIPAGTARRLLRFLRARARGSILRAWSRRLIWLTPSPGTTPHRKRTKSEIRDIPRSPLAVVSYTGWGSIPVLVAGGFDGDWNEMRVETTRV